MASWEEITSDAAALRTYLDGVDARLAVDGVAIHARSFHAWMAVQRDMNMSVPLGHPSMTVVNDYFAAKYGRRGLMDMSVGRMLVVFGPTFLLRWMLTPTFTNEASGAQGRTVLPKINRDALTRLRVPVAPMNEQHRIVAKLDAILELTG